MLVNDSGYAGYDLGYDYGYDSGYTSLFTSFSSITIWFSGEIKGK
jgi:hypothetical protein